MSSKIENSEKRVYIIPTIECVKLDNEIALALQSAAPPSGPGETGSLAPDYFKSDPYMNNVC